MFFSLCLAFSCAQEAAAPEPALWADQLPADTLFVAELQLDTWDRLRAATRAHGVLRDWDLITRMVDAGEADQDWPQYQMPGVDEPAIASFRDALVHSRFMIAMTPETLHGAQGVLLFVQEDREHVPEGLWPMYLRKMGCEPQRVGDAWLTVASSLEDPKAAEASLQAFLAWRAAPDGAASRTLGDDPRWRKLSRTVSGPDDLTRFHLLTWNLTSRTTVTALGLAEAFLLETESIDLSDDESTEYVGSMLVELLGDMGLMSGIAWTTSIDGEDVVDRAFLPQSEQAVVGRFFTPLQGGTSAALDRLAAIPSVHPSNAVVLGLDFSQYSRFLESLFSNLLESFETVEAPELVMVPAPPPPEILDEDPPEPPAAIDPGDPFQPEGPVEPEAPVEEEEELEEAELEEMSFEDQVDPTQFRAFLRSVSSMMAELEPELQIWTPIGLDEVTPFGGWRIKVRDRAALEAAYQSVPSEFRSSLEVAKASLALAQRSIELVDDEIILLRTRRFDQPLERTGDQPGFASARAEMERFLQGKEAISVQFVPAERDEVWLTRDGGLYLLLEAFCGKDFGAPDLPEDRAAHLQPLWSVAWRDADGLHWQARSTFGWAISRWMAESSRAAWRQEKLLERRSRDDFDEAEF